MWECAVTNSSTGPPFAAPLKLALQHFARNALQSVFMGTMCTQNLEPMLPALSSTSALWHRRFLCAASRRGYCQDFDLEKWLNRMPVSGVAGMLRTRITLADSSLGQDVLQPIGHEHVVWDVHPASGRTRHSSGLRRRFPHA